VPTDHDHLVSYYPLAGDYNDKVGTNHGTNNGSIFEKDLYRPLPEEPVQQTIDISALGEQDNFYYRVLFEGEDDKSFALDEVTIEYEFNEATGTWKPKIIFY